MAMATESIPGYSYGLPEVARSPVSFQDLEHMKNKIADSLSKYKIQLNPFVSRKIARISFFWIYFVLARFAPLLVTIW